MLKERLQLVRFPVYCRIKPHAPPLIQAPANLFRSPALRLFPRRDVLRKLKPGRSPSLTSIVDGMDYQSVKYWSIPILSWFSVYVL